MPRVHAFGEDALGEFDAVGLARAIRAGAVSRTDVAEAAIARAEAVNPALNGLAYNAFERARKTASAIPAAGYFSGVPTFVKDNVDVAGQPTMRGTDGWSPRDAPADGEFAKLYLATGPTLLGKTQMSEFGFSAAAEHPRLGPVRNPWNTDCTAGASSWGRPPSSRRAWCRSRTPTTAVGPSEFRLPATDSWASSRLAAACPWTPICAGCRWASSSTEC